MWTWKKGRWYFQKKRATKQKLTCCILEFFQSRHGGSPQILMWVMASHGAFFSVSLLAQRLRDQMCIWSGFLEAFMSSFQLRLGPVVSKLNCLQNNRRQFIIIHVSPSLYVLSLYYRHACAFESSRQECPCSALPQQGQSSWLFLFFFFLLFPCWGRAEQGNSWRELSNARAWR